MQFSVSVNGEHRDLMGDTLTDCSQIPFKPTAGFEVAYETATSLGIARKQSVLRCSMHSPTSVTPQTTGLIISTLPKYTRVMRHL